MKARRLHVSLGDLHVNLTWVSQNYLRPHVKFSKDTIQEVREFFGISSCKNFKSLEVAFLVRRMADMRVETIRRFTKSLIPGLSTTSNKNYYIKVLSYHYGSAIGYWNKAVRKNWVAFLLTSPEHLLDPYSTNQSPASKEKAKKKGPRKKRVSIYSVMEQFFVTGGTAKDCMYVLLEQFPTKNKIQIQKLMKMYMYKFRKDYKIHKNPKTKIITFAKEQ